MEAEIQSKKDLKTIWLRYALFLAVMEAAGMLLDLIVFRNSSGEWINIVITILANYIIGFPVLLLAVKNIPTEIPQKTKMGAGGLIAALCIASFLSIVGTVISIPLTMLSRASQGGSTSVDAITSMINSSSPLWSLVNNLVIVIIGPIIEELIFRKVLIDRVYRYGEFIAILISGVAFGIFHISPSQMIYTTLMGFVFAYVYVRTGDIRLCIGLHIANNLLNVLSSLAASGIDLQALTEAGNDTAAMEKAAGAILPLMVAGFVRVVIWIAGLVSLIVLLKKKKIFTKATSAQLPKDRRGIAFANIGFIAYIGVAIAVNLFKAIYIMIH